MTSTLLQSSSQTSLNAPTIHRLPSGLTIIAEQMPMESVNLSLWLNVGSAVESESINGMAHFLEHMIFKGTPRLQSGEFEQRVEERGAVTNAATSQDYTHYYITSAPQDFADLAPLLVEVMMNASIPDEGFERERLVVLEEIRRSQDNPRRRLFQHASETTFERLPYRRQVLGPVSVIEELTPQQMREFHTHWYQPQNVIAVVVGNLPVEELIRIVEQSFRPVDATPIPTVLDPNAFLLPPSSFLPELSFQEINQRQVTDETLQQARLVMTWRVPGMKDLEQTYALDILATVLGQGRTSRFFQDLREQRGLVSGISVSNLTYQHQGMFYISAQLPMENLAETETAIAQHIETIQQELIRETEIARIRTRVANHFIFGNETPSDRAGLYGYYEALVGDLAAAVDYPERIQSIHAEDLRDAAQQFLSAHAYGLVAICPAA